MRWWLTAFLLGVPALTGPVPDIPCTDWDDDGFFAEAACGTERDCNDAAASVHPAALEACNGIDDDCDGELDDDPSCQRTCDAPFDRDDTPIDGLLDAPLATAIARNGSGHALAWSARELSDEVLYFLTIDSDGNESGLPQVIVRHPGLVRGPSLVWTGSEYGLAWWDDSAGDPDIRFVRLDAGGQPLAPPARITGNAAASRWPTLAWTGIEYGLAWFDDRAGSPEVFFSRINRLGQEIGDEMPVTEASSATYPELVWSGTHFGVAYTASPEDEPVKRFLRLDSTGHPVGGFTDVAPGRVGSLVWTGTHYAIVGPDGNGTRRLYLSRLDAQGNKEGIDWLVTDRGVPGTLTSLAWTGVEFGIVWNDERGAIYYARAGDVGFPIGAQLQVSQTPPPVREPRLVWNGAGFDVFWIASVLGADALYRDRIGCDCVDGDGDGYGVCEECDDDDPAVFPGAIEVLCDDRDNDCDPATSDTSDDDGDGYGCSSDCDPEDPDVHPGATEVGCDGRDNDCDPATPDVFDQDLDGFACDVDCDDGRAAVHPGASQVCDGLNNDCDEPTWPAAPAHDTDADGDGFAPCEGDCNDAVAAVFPGAIEVRCDGMDNDCSSATPDVVDGDGDGFSCLIDCDDARADVFPSAPQQCDGVNNDCTTPDWPAVPTEEADMDLDGVRICEGDCDDTTAAARPGLPEVGCDTLDNDCQPATPDVIDADGDGFDCEVDCVDSHELSYPGAAQLCDGVNNDCDDPDWPTVPLDEADLDADGVPVCGGDCDDGQPLARPGLAESGCDGIDNDCDPATGDILDADADGFACDTDCLDSDPAVSPLGTELVCDGLDNDCDPATGDIADPDMDGSGCDLDCDEQDPEIHPQAEEVCDGIDNDCDGYADSALPGPRRINGFFRRPRSISVYWTGERFGVTWGQTGLTYSAWLGRYDVSGDEVAPLVRIGSPATHAGNPALTWTGESWGVVYWQLDRLFFTRIEEDGTSGDPVPLTVPGANPAHPAIVWTGTGFGVSWLEDIAGDPELHFRLISADGSPGERTLVAQQVDYRPHRFSLVWTGAGFGIAWSREPGVWFARLDVTGERIGPEVPISPEPDQVFQVALTWTGDGYAVAWDDNRNSQRDIYVAWLDTEGVRIGEEIRITDGSSSSSRPVLTWTGSELAVAYEDVASGISQLHLATIDEAGNVIEPPHAVTDDPVNHAEEVAMFWTGIEFGLVFRHRRTLYYALDGCDCYDRDRDGSGGCLDCDDTNPATFPGAVERCNGHDDNCDGRIDEDALGEDTDGDRHRNLCDNCPVVANPLQGDLDGDLQGDACDTDDGDLHVLFRDRTVLDWDDEAGFDSFNVYGGSLAALLAGGGYTQPSGSHPLAVRTCGLTISESVPVPDPTTAGAVQFLLVTGNGAEGESELGLVGGGVRPNDHPCP